MLSSRRTISIYALLGLAGEGAGRGLFANRELLGRRTGGISEGSFSCRRFTFVEAEATSAASGTFLRGCALNISRIRDAQTDPFVASDTASASSTLIVGLSALCCATINAAYMKKLDWQRSFGQYPLHETPIIREGVFWGLWLVSFLGGILLGYLFSVLIPRGRSRCDHLVVLHQRTAVQPDITHTNQNTAFARFRHRTKEILTLQPFSRTSYLGNIRLQETAWKMQGDALARTMQFSSLP